MKDETVEAVFRHIVEYKRTHDGCSPSFRHIQDHVGVGAVSTVHAHLHQLEAEGRIRLHRNEPRAIEVVGGKWTYGGISND